MLNELTVESFETHVGTSFWVQFANGSQVELRLTCVARVMESEAARLPRQPFSLYFDGPGTIHLPQRIYHLSHAVMPRMDIFLVPIGKTAQTYQYEAVFT